MPSKQKCNGTDGDSNTSIVCTMGHKYVYGDNHFLGGWASDIGIECDCDSVTPLSTRHINL